MKNNGKILYYNTEDIEYLDAVGYYSGYGKKVTNTNIDNLEIPTFAQANLYRTIEDGKYKINYTKYSLTDTYEGVGTVFAKICSTNRAKNLINNNRQKNTNIKKSIEEKIQNIVYNLNDIDEPFTQEQKIQEQEIQNNKENSIIKNENNQVLIFSLIIIGAIICLIILIINIIKINKK